MPKKKKICYQSHHVSYDELPDFTIPLRKWIHLSMTRVNQLKSTIPHLQEVLNLQMALQFTARRMIKEINQREGWDE